MTRFSTSDAIGEPFRLMRERPLWILLWGMPYAAVLAIMVPVFAATFADLPLGQADTLTDAELQAQFGQMMSFQLVSLLLNLMQLVGGIAVWGAVNRAVLSGRAPDRWAHFRLSLDELWLLVVAILLFVGVHVALIVVAILGLVVFGVVAFSADADPSPGWIVGILAGAGVVMVGVLAMLARTSLIAPASVHLKRLALPEGWRIAKAQTLRLLGLMVVTLLTYMALYLLVVGVVIGIVVAVTATSGPMPEFAAAARFGDILPGTATLILCSVVGFLPVSVLMGVFMAIYVAPFAHAFGQLWHGASEGFVAPRDPPASGTATEGSLA